jgi:hypothetical protein
VHYYTHHAPALQTILHIVVAPRHGDIYVDGRYLGQARTFRDGKVQFPVAPGRHTVQLHIDGTAYSRQVNVKAGSTTIVEAHLRR